MNNGFKLKNRVKELRARLNLRQSDLANEVDVTRQTILAIEKGRLNPSVLVSLKIARVLREPVDYVFYLEHQPKSEPAEAGSRVTPGKPESGEPPSPRSSDTPQPHAIFDFS